MQRFWANLCYFNTSSEHHWSRSQWSRSHWPLWARPHSLSLDASVRRNCLTPRQRFWLMDATRLKDSLVRWKLLMLSLTSINLTDMHFTFSPLQWLLVAQSQPLLMMMRPLASLTPASIATNVCLYTSPPTRCCSTFLKYPKDGAPGKTDGKICMSVRACV